MMALVIVLMMLGAISAQAQEANRVVDPGLYQALQYRMIGPYRGGRVTAVAGVRDRLQTFYMGSTGGGVWKTTNGGESWSNITDGQIGVGSVGAVSVAPSDRNVVYVGTGSACPRGNISAGDGIYRSTDAGKHWTHIGLPEAGQIGAVKVHPQNPDLVYVAALGNIFGPNPERGVYRSKDGGKSWEKVLFVSDSTGAVDLAMNPQNPRILYAAMWRAERKPWTLVDGGREGGIWKSVDGGDSWTKLEGGLPGGLLGRIGVTVSPADPDRVWALVQAKKEEDGGVYRSDDAGQTWKRINREHKLRQRGWYYSHIFADPQDENTVYAENTGFYRSTDGGKTFERVSTPHGDNHGLWINPDHPEIMIQSNDGGANISFDNGQSWSTQRNQPTAEFYRVEVDNRFPYRVYGAQQDNTTISVPSRMSGDLTPKEHWFSVGGGESGHVEVDPSDPDRVYAGSYSGEITRVELDKGYTQQMTEYPHYTEGTQMRNLKYRFQWNAPIMISNHNPEVIYHASQYVHKSTDGGRHWSIISPDLTANIDQYMGIPGGPIQHDATGVEVYGSIFALAESPQQEGELWAGSDDGMVHLTRDGGASWTDITPKDMPKEGTVNTIDVSTHAPGRAFMAVYRYRDHDFRPYIFRTDDYGQHWKLLTNGKNGIPSDHFVRVVREDPNRKGLLYAGTEYGMYVSFDDGAHWQEFQQNLPRTPVTDLQIHDKDLVLSTQGRSFWVIDDISPLYSLDVSIAKEPLHLFKPKTAWRTQLYGYRSSRAPEPGPAGALVYFNLAEKPDSTHPVRLEILKDNGTVIRTFSTRPDSTRDEEKLKAKSGMNRFEWDLRYPGPWQVEDLVTMVMRNPQYGPKAPSGTYKVRLSVNGKSQEQAFEVKADPRWEVTPADLQANFELARKIGDMISTSQHAVAGLRSMRRQVEAVASRVKDSEYSEDIRARARALADKTVSLENELVNNRIESGQDAIGMVRVFTNHIGRLYTLVINEDARPTGGIQERYEDLKKAYEGYMSRYREIEQTDLAAFNGLLEEAGLPHVFSEQ